MFPRFCPHGGTIPRKDQPLNEINTRTLNQITEPGKYQLSRIHDQYHLIQYLESHQLSIQTVFELQSIDSYAKTYLITYQDKSLIIPENIAKEIYVSEL